jgi:hypothetical protein
MLRIIHQIYCGVSGMRDDIESLPREVVAASEADEDEDRQIGLGLSLSLHTVGSHPFCASQRVSNVIFVPTYHYAVRCPAAGNDGQFSQDLRARSFRLNYGTGSFDVRQRSVSAVRLTHSKAGLRIPVQVAAGRLAGHRLSVQCFLILCTIGND